jgi:thiamine-phosphate pyrophosphorylase
MLLYYITDRKQFSGPDDEQRRSLLARIAEASAAQIDYIQLREKDLSGGELEALAKAALDAVRDVSDRTRLLINSRADVALAVGADGVHLTSKDVSPGDARATWATALRSGDSSLLPQNWRIGVSCHSIEEVRLAESHGADFAVLAPIFEKAGTDVCPLGPGTLRLATRQSESSGRRVEAGGYRSQIPIFALGGVTLANAGECIRAGAVGIAGIRIFQQGDIDETVKILRGAGFR